VSWTVWLEENKLVFTDKKACSVVALGAKIINLAQYWCSQKGKVNLLKLSLILSQKVKNLIMQVLILSEIEEDLMEEGEATLVVVSMVLNTPLMSRREIEYSDETTL
jgi:hypothetical protein